jgi:Domain of unknown function (DUF4352)
VEAVAPSAPARTGERPARLATLAKFVFVLTVVAALAATAWGVIYSLAAEAPPARVGETVEVPGGLLRVDSVSPEHMASMQMGKFAQAGMAGMSSMGMDMAPEGQRRFVVDVTLGAKDGDLSYSPEDFSISGEGVKQSAPIRDQLDSGTIPAGSAISGRLVFQVPEETTKLMLSFGDEGQKVALNLNESDAHSHSGAATAQSQAGEDHSRDHHHH